jgi:uroporphyrinogen-III synthase
MQSTRKHILSTRILGMVINDEARMDNIDIDEVPFIRTEEHTDDWIRDFIKKLSRESITVVFSSITSVEIVAKYSIDPNWKIYCVGNATRLMTERYFPKSVICGVENNASQLADLIIEKQEKDAVFFCGTIRGEELPVKLYDAGLNVREVVIYTTVETPSLLQKDYDGIMFFSPSAVRSFFSANRVGEGTVLFSIGNTTAAEVKKYSNNKLIIARQPSKEELLVQVIDFYAEAENNSNI